MKKDVLTKEVDAPKDYALLDNSDNAQSPERLQELKTLFIREARRNTAREVRNLCRTMTLRRVLRYISESDFLACVDCTRLPKEFTVATGVTKWPFASIGDFAVNFAPADVVIAFFRKGFEMNERYESALMSRSDQTRSYLVEYYQSKIEAERQKLDKISQEKNKTIGGGECISMPVSPDTSIK